MRLGRCGFTLIEILTVIAVIAVLAGLIFPVYSRAKIRAQRPACISNLQQIGMALHMYAQNWDGCAPPFITRKYHLTDFKYPDGNKVRFDLRPFNDAASLKHCLSPYGTTEDIWWCPLDTNRNSPGSMEGLGADPAETSYDVDSRIVIWAPLAIDSLPTVTVDEFLSWPGPRSMPIFFIEAKSGQTNGPMYMQCTAHMIRGDIRVLFLRFDGSVSNYDPSYKWL